MGREQKAKHEARMMVLDTIRGHDSTVAHSFGHTEGRCPKCLNNQLVRMFCYPEESGTLPAVRTCELKGEHIHTICAACKYPWVERPADQAMLAQERGELVVESELAAVLAVLVRRAGGITMDYPIVVQHRHTRLFFQRDAQERKIVVTWAEAPQDEGTPKHPEFPSGAELEGGA